MRSLSYLAFVVRPFRHVGVVAACKKGDCWVCITGARDEKERERVDDEAVAIADAGPCCRPVFWATHVADSCALCSLSSKKIRTCRRKSPSREQAPGRRHLFICFVSGREGERDGGREVSLVFRVLWPANRPVGGCCSVLSLSFSVAFAPPSSPHRIPSGEPASPSLLGLNARKRKEKETKSTESRERQSKKGAVDSGQESFFSFLFFFFLSLPKLSFFLLLPSSLRTSQAERDQSERHSLFQNKTVSPWSPRSAPSSSTRGSRRTRLMPPGRARGPREGEMRRR